MFFIFQIIIALAIGIPTGLLIYKKIDSLGSKEFFARIIAVIFGLCLLSILVAIPSSIYIFWHEIVEWGGYNNVLLAAIVIGFAMFGWLGEWLSKRKSRK